MKKETTRIFALMILGLFMFSFLAGVVSAQDIFDPVKDLFAKWEQGNLSVNIAKYAFFVLIVLLVYGILSTIEFVKKKWYIAWPSAIIISFLATAYLTPSEIYTMLISYSAMGFVLGAIIPFVIMIFFTIQVTKDGGAGMRIFMKLVWFAFILFLIYKAIASAAIGQIGPGWTIGYIIAIIFAIIYITVLNTAIVKMWFKEEIETQKQRLKSNLEKQRIKRQEEADAFTREEMQGR